MAARSYVVKRASGIIRFLPRTCGGTACSGPAKPGAAIDGWCIVGVPESGGRFGPGSDEDSLELQVGESQALKGWP